MKSEAKIMKLAARIDGNSAPKLEELLSSVLNEGFDNLILDLDETVYVSSAGLRVFLGIQKKINLSGGKMVLRNVKPQISEIFEVTGFSGILTIE